MAISPCEDNGHNGMPLRSDSVNHGDSATRNHTRDPGDQAQVTRHVDVSRAHRSAADWRVQTSLADTRSEDFLSLIGLFGHPHSVVDTGGQSTRTHDATFSRAGVLDAACRRAGAAWGWCTAAKYSNRSDDSRPPGT